MIRGLMIDAVTNEYTRDGKRGKRSLNAVQGGLVDIIQGEFIMIRHNLKPAMYNVICIISYATLIKWCSLF